MKGFFIILATFFLFGLLTQESITVQQVKTAHKETPTTSCVPSWTYSYTEKANTRLVKAMEKSIIQWENALNNPNLFTYSTTSTNIIGYQFLEDNLGGKEIDIRLENTVLGFNILIDNQLDINLVESVMLHEVGHAIGLDHSLDEGSVMYEYENDVLAPTMTDIAMAYRVFSDCDFKFVQ